MNVPLIVGLGGRGLPASDVPAILEHTGGWSSSTKATSQPLPRPGRGSSALTGTSSIARSPRSPGTWRPPRRAASPNAQEIYEQPHAIQEALRAGSTGAAPSTCPSSTSSRTAQDRRPGLSRRVRHGALRVRRGRLPPPAMGRAAGGIGHRFGDALCATSDHRSDAGHRGQPVGRDRGHDRTHASRASGAGRGGGDQCGGQCAHPGRQCDRLPPVPRSGWRPRRRSWPRSSSSR